MGARNFMKTLEVVDPAQAGRRSRTSSIPRLGLHSFNCSGLDSQRHFVREKVVRDAHFVPIGVAGEGEQRGLLRLPAEPPDALAPRGDVHDAGGAPADAVAVAVVRVFQREDRLVGDRLDQSRAEQRYRRAPRNHVGLRWNLHLAAVRRGREQVVQRPAVQCVNLPSSSR